MNDSLKNADYDISKVLLVLGNGAFADIFVKPTLTDSGIKGALNLISKVLKLYNFSIDNIKGSDRETEIEEMKQKVGEILDSVPENRGSFADWFNKISDSIEDLINMAGGETGTEKFNNYREHLIEKIKGIKSDTSIALENVEKKLSLQDYFEY